MKYSGMRIPMDPDKIKSEYLSGVYRDMAETVGIDAVLKIHASFRGQTVCFPVDIFSKEYIAECITGEYDGHNVKKLASKYGYSEKWVRKIIKESEDSSKQGE